MICWSPSEYWHHCCKPQKKKLVTGWVCNTLCLSILYFFLWPRKKIVSKKGQVIALRNTANQWWNRCKGQKEPSLCSWTWWRASGSSWGACAPPGQVKIEIQLWLRPVSYPGKIPFPELHKGSLWSSSCWANTAPLVESRLCDTCQGMFIMTLWKSSCRGFSG